MESQQHSSNRFFNFAILLLFTGLVVLLIAQVQNYLSLTGVLLDPKDVDGHPFVIATDVAHGDIISVPVGDHVIVHCPSTEPTSSHQWDSPASFSVIGLKIYEFSDSYGEEKKGNWPGASFGLGGSGPELSQFAAVKVYYVKADAAFDFSCSSEISSSSSSSSETSASSSSSGQSSSSSSVSSASSGSSSSSASGLDPDLVGYWPFDEGSGTLAADVIAGNNASGSGTIEWVTETPSALPFSTNAVRISGGSFSVISAPEFDFESTDPFTISLWYKNEGSQTGVIIGKFGNAKSLDFKGWQLQITPDEKLSFLLSDWLFDTTLRQSLISMTTATSFTTGVFHHFVVSYDGSGDAKGVRMWVDGTEQTPFNITLHQNNLGTDGIRNSAPLVMGAVVSGFIGIIDDVRIYGGVVAPTEILNP